MHSPASPSSNARLSRTIQCLNLGVGARRPVVRAEKTYRTQTSAWAVMKMESGTTKSQLEACSVCTSENPVGGERQSGQVWLPRAFWQTVLVPVVSWLQSPGTREDSRC